MISNIMDIIKTGPAGVLKEGTVWDEKGRCEIAKIFLSHDTLFIRSLQFLFVGNSNFVLSDKHGADHNYNFITVVWDYPSEFLTGIRGNYYANGVRSITFVTNKGSYGPYGGNRPKTLDNYDDFDFQLGDDRCFIGFFGTKTDNVIESIGLYLKPVTSSLIISTADSPVMTRPKRNKINKFNILC